MAGTTAFLAHNELSPFKGEGGGGGGGGVEGGERAGGLGGLGVEVVVVEGTWGGGGNPGHWRREGRIRKGRPS